MVQSPPDNSNLQGKSKKVRVIGSSKKIAGSKEKNSFYCTVNILITVRDLSEISRGEGGWKQREGHNFLRLRKGRGHEKWAVKRGRVMQI